MREDASHSVHTDRSLAQWIKRDTLGAEHQEMLGMIDNLLEQAEKALAFQMYVEAKFLTKKVITLSHYILKTTAVPTLSCRNNGTS